MASMVQPFSLWDLSAWILSSPPSGVLINMVGSLLELRNTTVYFASPTLRTNSPPFANALVCAPFSSLTPPHITSSVAVNQTVIDERSDFDGMNI